MRTKHTVDLKIYNDFGNRVTSFRSCTIHCIYKGLVIIPIRFINKLYNDQRYDDNQHSK